MTDHPIPVPPPSADEQIELALGDRFPEHSFELCDGDVSLWLVVVDGEAAAGELSVTDARKADPDVQVGDELGFILARLDRDQLVAAEAVPIDLATMGLDDSEWNRFVAEFTVKR